MPQRFFQISKLFAIVFFISLSVAAQKIDKDVRQLGQFMTGSFDTFAQVDRDEETDAKYRHIRALLHVTPFEIPELKNGLSFYVENAAAESRLKPYRQRVYFLTRENERITLKIYKINQPEDLINVCKKPSVLKNLTFERLTLEGGCNLIYEKVGENLYKGSNGDGKQCKSNLRGATYTHSESEISPNNWTNLDQGFDDAGVHKWGPPPGTIGHIFIKRKM